MVFLYSLAIMVYILASLFSIVHILLISRWIQYYQHAKQITQYESTMAFSFVEMH